MPEVGESVFDVAKAAFPAEGRFGTVTSGWSDGWATSAMVFPELEWQRVSTPFEHEPTTLSDLELLHQAREGEWEAFEALVTRLEPRVFALTRRILQQREDAEDATQQTFINVMEHLDRFRGEASVATWVLRIATNQALTILRKRRSSKVIQLDSGSSGDDAPLPHPDFIAQWHEDPADLAHRAEIRELLGAALAELDEKYRLVFVLRDVEGFTTRETAEMLEISESNTKVRLLRARLQLREKLTAVLGDEATRVVPDHSHHAVEGEDAQKEN